MTTNYPKFDHKIKTQIDQSRMVQGKNRPGVVMGFDPRTNSATVILDDHYSTEIGNIIHNVPCPVTPGIQSVSPGPGTRCLVEFRDDNESAAFIVCFFDPPNVSSSFAVNYTVNCGIPKYMAR